MNGQNDRPDAARKSRQLQADEDEQQAVEEEHEHVPERDRPEADVRGEDPRPPPPDVNACSHDGHHPRCVDRFAGQVRGKGDEQRDCN